MCREEPIPVIPTCHYNMGGIPTNMHGEAISPRDGDPDATVPGLMALGEAACVSVHGANRLGSNSLIDLVVFGRAAAHRCAELITKGGAIPELPKGAGEQAIERLDRFRYADGGTPTAELRLRMQKTMQRDCAVFRTKKVLQEGVKAIRAVWDDAADIRVTDRSLIWNTDLIETLEFDNLISQAAVTVRGRARPRGEPRRACARGLPQARRQELDEAHSVLGRLRHARGDARLPARCTPSRSPTRSPISSPKSGCIRPWLIRLDCSSLPSTAFTALEIERLGSRIGSCSRRPASMPAIAGGEGERNSPLF